MNELRREIGLKQCGLDHSRTGYAAAGAVASFGRLVCLSNIQFNTTATGVQAHSHLDRKDEGILSTTLPILNTLRRVRVLVYMTSYSFRYSTTVSSALHDCRGRSLTTVSVLYSASTDSFTWHVTHDGRHTRGVTTYDDIYNMISHFLGYASSYAVCDVDDVDLFSRACTNIECVAWFYPMSASTALESTSRDQLASYYCRAHVRSLESPMVVASFGRLRPSDDMRKDEISSLFTDYVSVLHDSPGSNGMCYSCCYVKAVTAHFGHELSTSQGDCIATMEFQL